MSDMVPVDYLVIGSGIAGLSFAIKMAQRFPDRKVLIATKADARESNTKYAQGGVATVMDFGKDSYKKHIQDTLEAGDGLCNHKIVEMVVRQGPERIRELIGWGVRFDSDSTGNPHLGMEGGHSVHRVLHHKDTTGSEIENVLLDRAGSLPNIVLWRHHFALDLIMEESACQGAYLYDQLAKTIEVIGARATFLATGGIGRIYGHTTNPPIATGDGIAMAHRAGALVRDMEFVQFHPTAFFHPTTGQSFLISEAVRGFGAHLRNTTGHRFLLDHDQRGELAPRDVVSRSIAFELMASGQSHVFLDCTHLDTDAFKSHFPTIHRKCLDHNIPIDRDWIPVVPAAHYLCGGIAVDGLGRTSIANLFACGECSRTGLHGANRLASNSLLEALVYAHNTYTCLSSHPLGPPPKKIPGRRYKNRSVPVDPSLIEQHVHDLQTLMRNKVGIVRDTTNLQKAARQLQTHRDKVSGLLSRSAVDPSLYELGNMIDVAQLIVSQSLQQKENKGGYYNVDHAEHPTALK